MENHPIPQDITGFQFKLIGDMTIKQFAYIAGFVIFGWVVYSFPIYSFIRIPLALLIGSFGAALAFVPISGRPMDIMIANFIRALFNPTQFVYEKSGGALYAHVSKSKVKSQKSKVEEPEPIVDSKQTTKKEEDKREMVYFSSLSNYQNTFQKPQVIPVPDTPHAFDKTKVEEKTASAESSGEPKEKERKMEEKQKELERELALARQQEQHVADPAMAKKAHDETIVLEEELRTTIGEKEKLERQLAELNRKLEQKKKTFFTPSTPQAPAETKNVRVVPAGQGIRVGLPIAPDSPNVVSGIIKDPRGNPLPNILVEVKDSSGNPVRAFKTNGVGQFASATALTNGVYTIEFEDPKEENKFDAIQFEAKGEIVLPIEIISVDKREELRRELFN